MIVFNTKTGVKKECNTIVFTLNMNTPVECPECGKMIRYGDGINAGDWYTENTMWRIGICPKCAEKIWRQKE